MKAATYEGVFENGVIRLIEPADLPENTRVLVVVPATSDEPVFHMRSPRLANPEDASLFLKEVIEESPDAGL